MKTISCGVWLLLSVASTYHVAGLTEHKVHNIVLYPDKHSWCKTTEIKQIVAYPGCSSIEIDNNVCVGACFSYSIPRTIPSAPGEVIIPYCDSCQPVDFEWREVTLTCSDDSGEEEEGQTEMTKRVQVITNCSCTSCEKQYEETKASDHQKHIGSKSSDDVPELMSLMMGVHRTQPERKDSEEEDEEATEDVNDVVHEGEIENALKEEDNENLIKDDDEEDGKELKTKLENESRTLEILHLKKHTNGSGNDFIEIGKSEHKLYKFGPHHSLVIKPDEEERGSEASVPAPGQEKHDKGQEEEESEKNREAEEEETPSLLMNQFKIHDNEEYLDQIAVESITKEVHEKKVLTVPDMIYNSSSKEGKWRMLEVPHHHLQPAVEGVEVSYFGKEEPKGNKMRDEQ